MNGKAKMIRTLGVALLSAAVILSSQSPAAAGSKRSSRAEQGSRGTGKGLAEGRTEPDR